MRYAVSGAALLLLATTAPQGQNQPPTVRTSTAGVLIDVTVVDKDGRAVTDLKAEDFEVNEDGKSQQIISATLMRGGVPARISTAATATGSNATAPAPAAATPAPGAAPAPNRPPTPTVTAILFDSLPAESRGYATRAAAQFISTLATEHEYAGVFVTGLGLTTMQPFTNDAPALRVAVDRVATTAPNGLSPGAEARMSTSRTQGLDTQSPVTAGAEDGRGWTTIAEHEQRLYGPSADPSEKKLIQLEQRMKEGFMQFLSEYQGDAALAALRSTIAGLAPLPGRKSILYFAEEVPITSRLKPRFDALIGEANRGNISVYTVDTAGLRVHSQEASVARGVDLAGAQGVGDAQRSDGAWTKDLERQEQALSSRSSAVLGRLANETGGFMIDSTNDLGRGVARMQVERTTYYLLGYQPTNASLDGKFRKVSVKVKRGKYTVRARPGYVATSPTK
jgi:VWFA-related protein